MVSFYSNWLELSREIDRVIFVKYIDLIKDIDNELVEIAEKINLKKKILYPFLKKRLKKVSQSGKFTKEREKYYLEKGYLKKYSQEQIALINELLDHRIVKQMDYKV